MKLATIAEPNPTAARAQMAQKWSEAHRRAETYLRALFGQFNASERQLLARAVGEARELHRYRDEAHPTRLVMEAIFNLVEPVLYPAADTLTPMAPRLHRTVMLPEPIEFPLHDYMRSS